MRKDDRVNIVLEKDGKYLILKRSGKKTSDPNFNRMPNIWEFPGGSIDEDEVPEQSIVRETLEECGLLVNSFNFIRKWLRDVDDDKSKWRWVNFFYSNDFSGEVVLSNEHSDFRWMTEEEIKMEDVGIDTLHYFEMN